MAKAKLKVPDVAPSKYTKSLINHVDCIMAHQYTSNIPGG